jgi:hypothetical protein
MKKKFLILSCFLQSIVLFSQSDLLAELELESEPEIQFVKHSWKSPYLINAYTTETERKGVLDFRISHRFGNLAGENGGGHTLFGLDQASNIRFSFDYGITEDFQIGFGRSKTQEHLDFLLKYKLLKQTKNGIPISIAVLSNSGFTPKRDPNGYFSKIAHRFMFINQFVIGRKFNDNFSLLTNISHFHKNLVIQKANQVLPRDQNDLFVLGFGVRYKLNRKLSLVGEYNHTFGAFRNSKDIEYYHPLSLGIELETGGHVFHINLSNSSGLIYQDLLDSGVDSYLEGEIKLGFTISRFFVL